MLTYIPVSFWFSFKNFVPVRVKNRVGVRVSSRVRVRVSTHFDDVIRIVRNVLVRSQVACVIVACKIRT